MLNSVVLMGRLTKTPSLKMTQSGKEVCSFCIAVDRGYGENKTADFIDVVAWEKTAKFVCDYFVKGQMIAVEGSLHSTPWTDDDGKRHNNREVYAREVSFCGSAQSQTESGEKIRQDREFAQKGAKCDMQGFKSPGTSHSDFDEVICDDEF